MSKSKAAAERDDVESVERHAGKIGFIVDKVVALVKLRAIAMEANMGDIGDPEPDPLSDPRLPKHVKDKVTADLARRESQLAEKRATAKVWKVEDEILDFDKGRELSLLRGVLTSVQ